MWLNVKYLILILTAILIVYSGFIIFKQLLFKDC
jgi:hypothetical protein